MWLNLRKFSIFTQISKKKSPEHYLLVASALAPFFGNLSESKNLSEIKPPLAKKCMY